MRENKYPDVPLRRIVVKGTKDVIELTGYLSLNLSAAYFELEINGIKHDSVELNISQYDVLGVFNKKSLSLSGVLEEDIPVRVRGTSKLSTRPKYLFYVGDQIVHKQLGDQGGL